MQIVLLNTYSISNLVKWLRLHCNNVVSHAYITFKSYNLILKVVFLFMELHTWKPIEHCSVYSVHYTEYSVQYTVFCTLGFHV